jgi:tellurite methyltransferase
MVADTKFARARAETISYHEQYYGKHTLFEGGSWLEKADAKLAELIVRFDQVPNCRVLDLGAGVGRNAIPLAQALPAGSVVTCVELLSSASQQLRDYAQQHGVSDKIVVVAQDYETISFPPDEFHLVIGISSLEHCSSHENLMKLVARLQSWTQPGGVHYMNFSTSRKVVDCETGEPVETLVETRLQTENWLADLADLYKNWNIEKLGTMESYSETLVYNGKKVIWSSDEMEILASRA